MTDPLGLNEFLTLPPHEYRIYLDDNASRYVVVDEIDYHWAIQWRWSVKPDKHRKKFYAVRTLTGRENGKRRDVCLFLHVEIMKRTGILPPSPAHKITDHKNGDEFNCRRHNLRWATPSMNRRNIKGSAAFDLMEDLLTAGRGAIPVIVGRTRSGQIVHSLDGRQWVMDA